LASLSLIKDATNEVDNKMNYKDLLVRADGHLNAAISALLEDILTVANEISSINGHSCLESYRLEYGVLPDLKDCVDTLQLVRKRFK